MNNFLAAVRNRISNHAPAAPARRRKGQPVEKTRHLIQRNRWDERQWLKAREADSVDKLVLDLMLGDQDKGGTRPAFDMAPELIEALWLSLYKAAPKLETKRNIARDAYPAYKIVEELLDNDKLAEVHRLTANDATMSTLSLEAMGDIVRDIIGRIPPPPQDGGGGGEGGGQGQPDDGTGQGQPQPGGGGGQGQPQPGGGGSSDGQPDSGDDGDDTDDEDTETDGDGDGEGEGSGSGQGEGSGAGGDSDDTDEDGDGDGEGQGQSDGLPGDDAGSGVGAQGEQPDGEHEADDDESEFDLEAEAADREEEDWQNLFDEALADLDLERAMDKALNAAHTEADDLDNQRRGIGLDDGTWQAMDPAARLAMADRLRTPEMRAMADIIGRMRRFAFGVRAKRIINVPHEAYDVEQGNDIRRLLRGEYALLSTPETSYEFYRRYADKELLQYKMRGSEDAGKGPMVVCVDKSASMSGEPFNWALAVCEALRRFAAEDERDFTVLFFGSNNDRHRFDFPKGSAPFEKILTYLGHRANGGTQFDGVLTEALQIAVNAFDGEAKGKADIVFITDGAAHLGDDWIKQFNAERERASIRNFGVQIGTAYDYYGGENSILSRVTDAVINVKEFKPESVQSVFAAL